MLYLKTNKIRRDSIKDILRFRSEFKDFDIEESKNHFVLSAEIESWDKSDFNVLVSSASYSLYEGKEIVFKIAGVLKDEIISFAYIVSIDQTTCYDTFEHCLATRNGIKLLEV